MSQPQAIVGVPVSYQPVSKYDTPRAKTALIVMISVLATSAIFMGVILGVMHRAQPTVERAQLVLGRAEQFMDYPSRVLHGNVFHVANNLAQTNWYDLSRNATKLTTALQQIFNVFDDYDRFNNIARIASFATSIANKIGWIKPNWSPAPIPAPSDDQGAINILSYITEWISQQVVRKDLADLASSCDSLTTNLLTIDWSGRYSWGKGRGYGAWDVNNWKQTVSNVQDYCRQFAKLPAFLGDDSELVDPVPNDDAVAPQPAN